MPVVYEGFVLEDGEDGDWQERGEGYVGDPHFGRFGDYEEGDEEAMERLLALGRILQTC